MHNPGYLLDLPSQAPSANIIVFMERDTKVVIGVTDPMKGFIHDRGEPTGGEILIRSSMKSVNRSILFSNLPEVERRAVTRLGLPLTGKVIFEIQGKEVEKAVKTKDISAAGGYFISGTSPAIGDQVKLLLQWPPAGKEAELLINATGTVLRIDALAGRKWGFAVLFDLKRA
jgi:hypothetical protein